MSRSTRRPYSAVTGVRSAKDDKRLAHRGVRRAQDLALRTAQDHESLLLPHPLSCSWNNVYSWGRDGGQSLCDPPDKAASLSWYRMHHYSAEDAEKNYREELRRYQRRLRK